MLAGLLSLLPGLGQVYVGYYQQGFINVLVVASIISILNADMGPLTPLGAFFTAFYWLYNIVDATRRAAFYNQALVGIGPLEVPDQVDLPGGRGSLLAGILLVVFGGFALAHTVFDVPLGWLREWWPAALIVVGAVLIYQAVMQRSEKKKI